MNFTEIFICCFFKGKSEIWNKIWQKKSEIWRGKNDRQIWENRGIVFQPFFHLYLCKWFVKLLYPSSCIFKNIVYQPFFTHNMPSNHFLKLFNCCNIFLFQTSKIVTYVEKMGRKVMTQWIFIFSLVMFNYWCWL